MLFILLTNIELIFPVFVFHIQVCNWNSFATFLVLPPYLMMLRIRLVSLKLYHKRKHHICMKNHDILLYFNNQLVEGNTILHIHV